MKISVEKVVNGYIVRVGTGRPHVVVGHGTKDLAILLAKLFGNEEVEKS